MNEKNEVYEIDLLKLLKALWSRIFIIIAVTVIGGAISFGYTKYFVTPMYDANIMVYVNNSSLSIGDVGFNISSSDISASKSLVDTYIVILKSRNTLTDVISEGNFNYSYDELSSMISASSVNNTEVFKVIVTSADPNESKKIANVIADVLPDKVASIVDGSSVRIVDYAVEPSHRSSPSYTKNIAIGMILGFILVCAVVIISELFDDTIREEDYLEQTFKDIPVLASIPNLLQGNKARYRQYNRGSYSSYSKYGDNDSKGGKN